MQPDPLLDNQPGPLCRAFETWLRPLTRVGTSTWRRFPNSLASRFTLQVQRAAKGHRRFDARELAECGQIFIPWMDPQGQSGVDSLPGVGTKLFIQDCDSVAIHGRFHPFSTDSCGFGY